MKTSARNQFFGKVSRVVTGAVNDEIEISIPGLDTPIAAIITHASTQALGLAAGVDAFALVKASSVIVLTDDEGAKFSARNRLQGTVARVHKGAVNSEVVITLAAGVEVAAIITNDSCEALALEPGMAASALMKASSVIVGVAA